MTRLTPSAKPQLRFNGFHGSWTICELGDYLTFKNGINADKDSYGSGYKFINVLDIINNDFITNELITGTVNVDKKTFEKNEVLYGDLLFQRSSENREEAGQSNVYLDHNNSSCFGGFVIRGRAKRKYNPVFLNYLLKTDLARKEIISKSGGSTRYNVGQDTLSEVKIYISGDETEQQKIADVLSAVDKKISFLKEKHALLGQYKKGVMQKLFNQEIRFKDKYGNEFPDWQEMPLSRLSVKVSSKNTDGSVTQVLTNSAKDGIVNQGDYFKKDIANQGNLGGYTIVEKDDFVYNPRISVLAPVGPIKRNHKGQGVMSPLYTVFRFKDQNLLDFVEQYFNTTMWHRYMHSIANFGARHDRMNITTSDFYALPVLIPSKEEREKIVAFIRVLGIKCEAVKKQLELTQTFKKGLLQQMFV
ncbi:MAG: restriction endonuclease subunit S [Alteromonas sp.]|nr:MAG: restriction endonuclease subunit S [Alteromonas sp.]